MASIIISLVAVFSSVCFSLATLWRGYKKEAKFKTEERTTIIVKLENIGSGINEIKSDIKAVRSEMKDHETRLIKLEEHYKSLMHNMEKEKVRT